MLLIVLERTETGPIIAYLVELNLVLSPVRILNFHCQVVPAVEAEFRVLTRLLTKRKLSDCAYCRCCTPKGVCSPNRHSTSHVLQVVILANSVQVVRGLTSELGD